MTLSEELALDLGAAIEDYGQTLEWKGTTYACVRKSAAAGLGFQDGGEVENVSEMIVVARNLFTGGELPKIGDGIDSDTVQIKLITPSLANLTLFIGSFDAP